MKSIAALWLLLVHLASSDENTTALFEDTLCSIRKDCQDQEVCSDGKCSACSSLPDAQCVSPTPCLLMPTNLGVNLCNPDLLSMDLNLDEKPPYMLTFVESLVKVSVMVIAFPVKRTPLLASKDYALQLAVLCLGLVAFAKDVFLLVATVKAHSSKIWFLLAEVLVILVTSSNTVAALAVQAQVKTYVHGDATFQRADDKILSEKEKINARYGPIFVANYYFLQVVYFLPMKVGWWAIAESEARLPFFKKVRMVVGLLTKKLEVHVCRAVLKLHSDKLELLHPVYARTAGVPTTLNIEEGTKPLVAKDEDNEEGKEQKTPTKVQKTSKVHNSIDISGLYLAPFLGTILMAFCVTFWARHVVGDGIVMLPLGRAFQITVTERSYSTYFAIIGKAFETGLGKAMLAGGSIANRVA